jgi:hypothetical protein
VTILLKMLLTMFCRQKSYRYFYRIKPQVAQVSSLALEWWYVALGGAIILGRVLQYLLAAVFWVGRCDVPFLHPDVQLFGYSFDYIPTHFTKDLLVHEAHRHPYIERLAQLYLMKLRHGTFVSDAGAAWRQLAVLALFPWLSKHRVLNKEKFDQAKKALVGEQLARAHAQPDHALTRIVRGMAAMTAIPMSTLDSNKFAKWVHPLEVFSEDEQPEEFVDAIETS